MNKKTDKDINILYIHNRPSGGAGESLFQMVNNNRLWNSKGIVFLNSGFLKEKFDHLNPAPVSHYLNGSSWLGTIKNKSWLFWPTRLYNFSKSRSFQKQIDQIVTEEGINVLHTNTINIIEGGMIAKKRNIPHFIQVRELMDLEYYKYPISKKWIIQQLHQHSDALIANSFRTKEGLVKLGGDPERIRVIYNTVSPTPRQEDIREYLNLPKDMKIVALVGWITPNKMVEDFLEIANAFQDQSDTKFVIIGDYGFDKAYNSKIKKKSTGLPNVIHAGLIHNATEYMGSFDVLLCTCYTESYGRTVTEALIAGTPAIGVKSCAVGELIRHGKSGFVTDKSDISSFVKYTRRLLEDQELNSQMSKFGQEDAESRFGLTTIRNNFLQLYKEFLK